MSEKDHQAKVLASLKKFVGRLKKVQTVDRSTLPHRDELAARIKAEKEAHHVTDSSTAEGTLLRDENKEEELLATTEIIPAAKTHARGASGAQTRSRGASGATLSDSQRSRSASTDPSNSLSPPETKKERSGSTSSPYLITPTANIPSSSSTSTSSSVLALPHSPTSPSNKSTVFRILTANDIYVFEQHEGMGGYPGLSTLLQFYRTPNSLFILNGDFLGGSHLSEHFHGDPLVPILHHLKTDLIVVGNHEFDFGHEIVTKLASQCSFPWLGANVIDKRTGKLMAGLQDMWTHTIKIGHVPIVLGFFGICAPETPSLSFPGKDIEFLDEIETSKKYVKILTEEKKADVIIAVTHLSIASDQRLAEKVNGIHLILGGHDHTPFQLIENNTLIFKAGQNANWLGIIDLQIELEDMSGGSMFAPRMSLAQMRSSVRKPRVRVTPSYQMIVNRQVYQDPKMEEIIGKFKKKLDEDLKSEDLTKVISVVEGHELTSKTALVRTQNTSFPNLVADATLKYFQEKEYPATLGVINGGFIRGDKIYPKGSNLTIGEMKAELPFPKAAQCIKISGVHLYLAFEQMLAVYPAASGSFPHLSEGWELRYDSSKLPLSRIVSLTHEGKEVPKDQDYTVVINCFMYIGGDGVTAWTEGVILNTPMEEMITAQIIIRYLQTLQKTGTAFIPTPNGRVINVKPS